MAKRGPKTKLTPENKKKLEEAAALDCSTEEMALYCDVTKQTIHNWLRNDPELFDRIETLRLKPILAARKRIVQGVEENYSNAMDYAKRKRNKEFGDRVQQDVNVATSDEAREKAREALKDVLGGGDTD